MAKVKTHYSCQSCGYNSHKWLGRCPGCETWSSFVEETETPSNEEGSTVSDVRNAFRTTREGVLAASGVQWVDLQPDKKGAISESQEQKRLQTGIQELDRVLGGGLIPDSFTLLGGDPGIGKSTLLLQMAGGLCRAHPDIKVFYVSGEESIDQIRGRAQRLGVEGKGRVFLAAETHLEKAFTSIKELKPDVVIMDSLQTFSSGFVPSAPGSVTQVREVAARLMALAKSAGIAVWLVGHVTKEGNIAGPKTIEHMVDTVLYFEGESGQSYRLLRTVKNRFGSSRELGVFEMDGEGLREVTNPSSLFLSDRKSPVSGTAVAATLEGSRPLLVELQALVTPSGLAMPRRTSVGLEASRVSLLAAILEKHMKLNLAAQDLFFNVSGGMRLADPACDLAAAAAIWSSFKEQALPLHWMWMGELGLTGEVRRVSQPDLRIEEARRLGFKTIILPQNTPSVILERFSNLAQLKIKCISRIDELSELLI